MDCAYEQKIGMAPYFNPYILGDSEIMLNEGTMNYLGLSVGDMVNFTISLASSTTQSTMQETPLLTAFTSLSKITGFDIEPLKPLF